VSLRIEADPIQPAPFQPAHDEIGADDELGLPI
jgi:hypothetical protein